MKIQTLFANFSIFLTNLTKTMQTSETPIASLKANGVSDFVF